MKGRIGLAPALMMLAAMPIQACSAAPQEAGLNFYLSSPPTPAESVRFRFDQGKGWRDAARRPAGKQEPLFDYDLAPSGEVQAEAILLRGGKPAARVRVTFDVAPDRFYLLHAAVQPDDPTTGCMGCIGVTSAPILGETGPGARRLWLYWSFDGISLPIMF